MTRVASVTPVALERDSRTLKHASSLAAFGYESIVVEGDRSSLLGDLAGIERISADAQPLPAPDLEAAEEGADPAGSAEPPGTPRSRTSRTVVRLLRRLVDPIREAKLWLDRQRRERLPFTTLRIYWDANRRTLDVLPEADVYYMHSFWQFPAAYWKSRRNGAAIIYDAHDSYWDDPPQVPLVPPVLNAVERWCVRRATAHSTSSPGLARRLGSRFGRPFAVVCNCHDPRLDEPVEVGLRDRLSLSDDDFLTVMAGNDRHGIATSEVIEAVAQVDGVHVCFLGAGYERHVPGVAERGLGQRVHFLAPVKPTMVAGVIRSADAALVAAKPVSPAWVNAIPNKLFHAVAAELPVIYPDVGEIGRIAREHRLGIGIDPAEPDEIASAIRQLRDDAERLGEYRENARKAARILNWQRQERVIAELVRSTLSESHPPR